MAPFFWVAALGGQTVTTNVTASSFGARAEKKFQTTQSQFKADLKNPEMALRFGQACFDWAEFAEDNDQREKIALEGIAACRQVVARLPKAAAGHYYLAMNLGQLARTKSLGALRLVDEMEIEFQTARDLDEKLDFAGPDRNLGLLYCEAPGWPTSIGNRSKARHHLQRAVLLRPTYPENRLNLLESYLKWGDKTGAQHEYIAARELWTAAKKELSGEEWESSWSDWEKRWKKIQAKFGELDRSLITPRGKK